MKFNFKIQQYQTDAVDAVVNVFAGQPYSSGVSYIRDTGTLNQKPQQLSFLALADNPEKMELEDLLRDSGYKNEAVALSDDQLLQNIHTLQSQNNIKLSPELVTWGAAAWTLRWKPALVKPMSISKPCSS